MATQVFYDLKALANAGSQMGGACDEIALVEVVRFDAAHEQLLHLRLHHGDIVIDVAKEDGLIAEGNPGVCQTAERVADFGSQFARMVRMNADEERMKFFQHLAQFRRDALGQKNRNARADAQKFQMRNRAKLAEEMFEAFVTEEERVAAAEED